MVPHAAHWLTDDTGLVYKIINIIPQLYQIVHHKIISFLKLCKYYSSYLFCGVGHGT